jgi:predicted aspartyl protease
MKHPYNAKYVPPIPIVEVRLSTPELGLYTAPLSAIIDTGADGTIVPTQYLRTIQAAIEEQGRLSSQWGQSRLVNLYLVDIEIDARTLPGIWVVGDTIGNELILGRNVLNRLRLLLDGLSGSSEVLYL